MAENRTSTAGAEDGGSALMTRTCEQTALEYIDGALICAFAPGAAAAGPDCSAIESINARLACYDAASPPKIRKPEAVVNDGARPPYTDPFLAEDARTTAKLKNICRGC
jgi:hypothetical protein